MSISVGFVVCRTVMSFKTSSITRTGALISSTAFHSIQFRGVMANSVYNVNWPLFKPMKWTKKLTVKKGT